MLGIAIPVTDKNSFRAEDIIKKHMEVGNEFYFSTQYKLSHKKCPQINLILLYNKSKDIYYMGDVESACRGGEAWIPDDAAEFSPTEYADVPKPTWIRVRNLKRVRLSEDISKYRRMNGEDVTKYIERTKRANRFYFK